MTTLTTPRAAAFATFPDDVQPIIEVQIAAIEGYEPSDRNTVFVNREDGKTTYSTREQIPGLQNLYAATDWRSPDGTRTGHFVGWYGFESVDASGIAALVLLSNVGCTVYDWCDGHEALTLNPSDDPDSDYQNSAKEHHAAEIDVVEFGDLSPATEGTSLAKLGGIDKGGCDRLSLNLNLDFGLDRAGALALASKLEELAERLRDEATGMAADQ